MERKNFSRAPDFDVKAEQHRACLAGSGAAYSVSSKQATIQGPLPYLEKGGGEGGVGYFFLSRGLCKANISLSWPHLPGLRLA